ncbi:hypothetical protein ACFYVL_39810 [Streptomyces sp. NPDC004111]|uniref:SCO2583 family membrane protein n=1 Tax=Streptomyces sp. NPDC004111 TaxID=3364690 RepID=UPI00369EA11E
MAGRSEPPEGTPPEGLPNSGDDDYRSVVFDESFVRAARLQEYSASERAGDHAPAVRILPPPPGSAVPGNSRRQVMLLVLLVVLAFGTAVYMGVRDPAAATSDRRPEALRATVVPLAPRGRVPGGTPEDLFEHSPAAQFGTGAEGIQLPVARSTDHFSESQVLAALTIAKDYLVESSVDPGVLTGGAVRPVRLLLDPDQLDQYDAGFASSQAVRSGEVPGAGGWLVRFDPTRVSLAGGVRANGTLRAAEVGPDILDVITDHTFVYPLRPAARTGRERADGASLFTVRRELHFRYDAEDLRRHRTELLSSYAVGGPQACGASSDPAVPQSWSPLLAGQQPPAAPVAGTGTDPYATGAATGTVCGTLAPTAMPGAAPAR